MVTLEVCDQFYGRGGNRVRDFFSTMPRKLYPLTGWLLPTAPQLTYMRLSVAFSSKDEALSEKYFGKTLFLHLGRSWG
jgi:hypothetical protein